jgi:hypothetical protein
MRQTATPATPATTTTTSAAPREGGAAPDLFERLAAPFAAEEVRSRRGPRGDLRTSPHAPHDAGSTTSSGRTTGRAASSPPTAGSAAP